MRTVRQGAQTGGARRSGAGGEPDAPSPSEQLDAVGEATRRAILDLLAARPSSVAELADRLPVSRPAVSQHLKVLKDARLVRVEARGTRRVYSLDPAGTAELQRYVTQLWDAALSDFDQVASRHEEDAR